MKTLSDDFLHGLDVRCAIDFGGGFANGRQVDGNNIVADIRELMLDDVVDSGPGEGSRDQDDCGLSRRIH
jgi:hypothetical protein